MAADVGAAVSGRWDTETECCEFTMTERTIMQEYEMLRDLVESVTDDVAKAVGGNKAAGTRVRKVMQDVKDAAQGVRKKILEVRAETP